MNFAIVLKSGKEIPVHCNNDLIDQHIQAMYAKQPQDLTRSMSYFKDSKEGYTAVVMLSEIAAIIRTK